MTNQERNKVLKMIEEGKINPDEGLKLLQALEQDHIDDEVQVIPPPVSEQAETRSDPELSEKISRLRGKLWQIPLWIGIAITILGSWLVYWVMQETGMGFWFYCSWLPFLIGVLFIGIAWGSRTSRWIHVRVQRKPETSGPKNISISFPLPLRLTGWVIRTFGHNIRDLERTAVDEVVQALEHSINSDTPLYVEVDEDDDDDVEHVQVYIG